MATADNGTRQGFWRRIPIGSGVLNEAAYPARMDAGDLQVLVNGVYRRLGAIGKRTGSGPYAGTGTVGTNQPVVSGTRWYRGFPSALKQMVVQSADALYYGNDSTGVFTKIGNLSAGSTPAFFATALDPAESGVAGTPESDILICAYGSGPPMKYDGANFTQLNAAITNHFTGCETYHQHVALWGDPDNPDTVFFTDLSNPESYTFSQAFGGYDIAVGDGDPTVQRCITADETLFVFKTNNIYDINGFDFQSGEYQFSDQPYCRGVGIPSPHAVTNLRGTLFFWSGMDFYMLVPGMGEPQPIGTDLINTIATAAAGNQSIVRAAAGSFLVQGASGPTVYNDLVLFAIDDGTGVAQKILVYDAWASQRRGRPHWSVWTGMQIGCFIPWQGPGDIKRLYFGSATTDLVSYLGQNATADGTNAIPVQVQTFRDDFGTPDQEKVLDRLFLEVESGEAVFTIQVLSESNNVATQNVAVAGAANTGTFGSATFGTSTFGSSTPTAYQSPLVELPEVYGRNFSYIISESSATSAYEIVGLNQRVRQEAYPT